MIEEKIHFILKRLKDQGFQAYLAGGAVRDLFLQRKSSDTDILTNAAIPEIKSIFSGQRIRIVGKTFPICIINGVEVSSGRAGTGTDGFPESDLAKRDFTINAMAFDPVSNLIIDPFNGRKDIEDRIIRFTRDPLKRIEEDPVRMVRACRFLALVKGSFSLSTLDALHACRDLLAMGVAKERISHEIMKAMMLDKPSLFFRALQQTGLLPFIFPSLDRCFDLDGGIHHQETVFEHCMLVGDALPSRLPALRLAGFLHDTGKFDAATIENGNLTFAGHENHTQEVVKDLTGLRFAAKDISYINALIKAHMRPLTPETTPRAARRLLSMLNQHGLSYQDFMRMRIADKKGNLAKKPYTISEIRFRLKKLFDEIHRSCAFNINDLDISGHEISDLLNITPSPEIGRLKEMLFEKVLDDPLLNQNKELKKLCLSLAGSISCNKNRPLTPG
ncbi:MAG: tRNA nucleotidyltransferase [Desulfobacterales bacterium RIFOXYA12_FULL_46_15]|nr:MAG: tRNA nucleotidyltransferase [Desulfobacterales bacterium RIFOXYA12_FULL_46_15]